jgi:hypothetical protein
MPWTPTRSYGGGAGKVYTNPWGAKTTVAKGGAAPVGPGKYGFGEVPKELRDMFGPMAGTDPQSAAEGNARTDLRTPQGQALKDMIAAYRRNLMQSQKG